MAPMIYLDTSVLVALHTREPLTDALHAWYGAIGAVSVSTAAWTMTEFARALGVKQRTQQITRREATAAWRSFDEHCAGDLHLIDIDRSTFIRAADLLRGDAGGLRAGDALHLAAATNAGVASLASTDLILNRVARGLGLAVVDFRR